MVKQDKKISDLLHFKQTDACNVCHANANNNELFLKFHPDDLDEEYKI